MITHTHTRGIVAGGLSFSRAIAVSAGAENNIGEPIPASGVNQPVAFAVNVSKLQSLFIVAAAALVIKTNSSGSPANTITLAADQPFIWQIGDGTLRDTAGVTISTNISSLFVTNPVALPIDLQIFALVDPT